MHTIACRGNKRCTMYVCACVIDEVRIILLLSGLSVDDFVQHITAVLVVPQRKCFLIFIYLCWFKNNDSRARVMHIYMLIYMQPWHNMAMFYVHIYLYLLVLPKYTLFSNVEQRTLFTFVIMHRTTPGYYLYAHYITAA